MCEELVTDWRNWEMGKYRYASNVNKVQVK